MISWELRVRKIIITSQGSNKGVIISIQANFEFCRPYCEMQPAKLTNHDAHINREI